METGRIKYERIKGLTDEQIRRHYEAHAEITDYDILEYIRRQEAKPRQERDFSVMKGWSNVLYYSTIGYFTHHNKFKECWRLLAIAWEDA